MQQIKTSTGNTYKKGSAETLSKHFRSREFDCKGKGCCRETKIDGQLVAYLQAIREHFGAPVTVTSGYRCAAHNATVANAAPNSRHVSGAAADIQVKGIAPAQVAKYAESIGIRGIGLYDTFVHIDTRTEKSFWYGHQQQTRHSFGGAATEVCEVKLNVLKKGSRGEDVRALQKLLGVSADGIFGAKTDDALRSYQKKNGLASDGICGAKSWAKLLGAAV